MISWKGRLIAGPKSTLQFPRRVAETFQNETSPLGLFAAGIFTQDIKSVVGQEAFGKLKSIALKPSF